MSKTRNLKGSTFETRIHRHTPDAVVTRDDLVAVEEPLEIQVAVKTNGIWNAHAIAVTMRTPQADLDAQPKDQGDFQLAAGFLLTEDVIADSSCIDDMDRPGKGGEENCNMVRIWLKEGTPFDLNQLSRHTFMSSSCGICGKQTIARIRASHLASPRKSQPLSKALLYSLPDKLSQHQDVFEQTGGIHGCALFDPNGAFRLAREDVGRHNALDKLIGSLLLNNQLPASDTILTLSGRASFELVQKAAVAGIPHIVALGPPSSLALELAQEFNITLVGFLKGERFNLYHGDLLP